MAQFRPLRTTLSRILTPAFPSNTRLPVQYRRSHTLTLRPFGPEVAISLASHGFAVFDSTIYGTEASALRAEIDLLAKEGLLTSNTTHLVSSSGATVQLRKHGVFESELHTLSPELRHRIPYLTAVEQDPTIRALLNVLHPKFTLLTQALKAKRSIGNGACFPMHVDSAPTVDNRIVTALLYLNSNWDCSRDGGALRLYPFPNPPVDIAPVEGRLVLLSGTQMLHRVLPADKTRYALTLWLSGSYRAQSEQSFHTDAYADPDYAITAMLLSKQFRPLTTRVALREEWDLSLREAHPPTEATAALERHEKDRETIIARLPAEIAAGLASDPVIMAKIEHRVRQLLGHPDMLLKILQKHGGKREAAWL